MSLRELIVCYDAYLLETWDHTSLLACLQHNLTVVVINMVSKSRAKPRAADYFHPYRKKKKQGLSITKENFKALKIFCGGSL